MSDSEPKMTLPLRRLRQIASEDARALAEEESRAKMAKVESTQSQMEATEPEEEPTQVEDLGTQVEATQVEATQIQQVLDCTKPTQPETPSEPVQIEATQAEVEMDFTHTADVLTLRQDAQRQI